MFSRLKNLVYDDIECIEWEVKYKIPKILPKDRVLDFAPEKLKDLKRGIDVKDNVNQWVQDTIFNTILRKKFDKYSDDKQILFLYRLLAILYRISFPIKGHSLQIDTDVRSVLERQICNAAIA